MTTRRRRILLVAPQPFFQWRGSPIRVGFDARALAELGYEVDLLTLPLGERRDIPGVRVIRVPNLFFARRVPIGPSLVKAAFDVLLLAWGAGLMLRRRYDVVHAVEDAGPAGLLLAGLGRGRLVFEKHSDPASYRKGPVRNLIMRMYAAVERWTARRADAAIGTGPGLVEQIRRAGAGAPLYHIFDIPSSLVEADPAATAEVRRRLRKTEQDVLIAFVGSFAVYQGVDLMFDAIPAVVRACPRARFVIVGGSPAEIAERREWLAERGAGEAVSFLGHIPPDELPLYLAASDILLSPRRAGVNTPLKLLDYLKAGRAIVASDIEANRLILDSATACLVPPTPEAFAAGIVRLANDEVARTRLGEAGRRLYAGTYNYREFKERLRECYERLVGR